MKRKFVPSDDQKKDLLYRLDDDVRRDAMATTARVSNALCTYIEGGNARGDLQHALTTARQVVRNLEEFGQLLWLAEQEEKRLAGAE